MGGGGCLDVTKVAEAVVEAEPVRAKSVGTSRTSEGQIDLNRCKNENLFQQQAPFYRLLWSFSGSRLGPGGLEGGGDTCACPPSEETHA